MFSLKCVWKLTKTEDFKDAIKENFWLRTLSRVVVLQVKESVCLSCFGIFKELTLHSFKPELKSYQGPLFFSTDKTALFFFFPKSENSSFNFFLNSVETAGTAEADTCSRRGPHSHYSQQYCNYCLNSTESCGRPFNGPSSHWNKSSPYYKSGFSSYSNIPTEQEFPSDFCYLG